MGTNYSRLTWTINQFKQERLCSYNERGTKTQIRVKYKKKLTFQIELLKSETLVCARAIH